MSLEQFAVRIWAAHNAYEGRVGRRVTQADLAVMVSARLEERGRKGVTQSAVARWFDGTVPDDHKLLALADLYGVDPGWLRYGALSAAPQQRVSPALDTERREVPDEPGIPVGRLANEMFPKRAVAGDPIRPATSRGARSPKGPKRRPKG